MFWLIPRVSRHTKPNSAECAAKDEAMLAFVDESGDSGRKILNRSSRFFVIAAVVFQSDDDANDCDAAIARLRQELNLPARFEFHYAENSWTKVPFLNAAAQCEFAHHIFAVDKREENASIIQRALGNESIYHFALRNAFSNAKPWLAADGAHGTSVVIDKSGDKKFRNDAAALLRRHITDGAGDPLIGKVKIQRSSGNNLLQLADYVAGIANRSLQGRREEGDFMRRYLTPHQETMEVWPVA